MTDELTHQLTHAARAHAKERDTLSDRVANLHAEIEAVKRRYLPGIRNAAARARETREEIEWLIEANPEAFVKPRTVTLSGVKMGLQKQKGTVAWKSPSSVVKAIEKHLPERYEELVEVTEKPRKSAVAKLTIQEARKIGCTLTEDSDKILIKSAHDDVDKLVSKLLEESETEG